MSFAIQIWVIDRGGPVFVSAYLPMQTMLVAIMATIVLGEEFYLGGWVLSSILLINCFLHLEIPMQITSYCLCSKVYSKLFCDRMLYLYLSPRFS